MSMVGDGESQPTEGEVTLDDIADAMVGEQDTPDESEKEGEESEESEVEGSDDGAEEGEDDEQEEPEFTIKVDGKDLTLKQSELIELAQKGTDYTKKTMALGDERRAFESEREEVRTIKQEVKQRHEQVVRDLEVVQAFMEQQLGDPPDVSLAAHDVSQYILAKELYEGQRAKLHQVAQALHQMRQQQEAEQASQRQQRQAKVERELIDSLPGWKDAPAEKFKETADYVMKLGLTPESVGDAALERGFWEMAHKAKAFDAIQAQKAQMKPKAQLAKVDKPAAKNPTGKAAERAKREAAFARNPSVDALADLLR